MSRRSVSPERPSFDVARAIDVLRQGAARTEALVYATEQQLERSPLEATTGDADDSHHPVPGR